MEAKCREISDTDLRGFPSPDRQGGDKNRRIICKKVINIAPARNGIYTDGILDISVVCRYDLGTAGDHHLGQYTYDSGLRLGEKNMFTDEFLDSLPKEPYEAAQAMCKKFIAWVSLVSGCDSLHNHYDDMIDGYAAIGVFITANKYAIDIMMLG